MQNETQISKLPYQETWNTKPTKYKTNTESWAGTEIRERLNIARLAEIELRLCMLPNMWKYLWLAKEDRKFFGILLHFINLCW